MKSKTKLYVTCFPRERGSQFSGGFGRGARGWCTGQITYGKTASPYQCAGKEDAAASGFTCEGHFQTSNCDDPGNCGLEGTFRGLRIDNEYDFGEWSDEARTEWLLSASMVDLPAFIGAVLALVPLSRYKEDPRYMSCYVNTLLAGLEFGPCLAGS